MTRRGAVVGLLVICSGSTSSARAQTPQGTSRAAAAITEGVDYSYLQRLFLHAWAELGGDYARMYGGLPWGEHDDTWRESAPGFNLDRVRTPLRLEALSVESVLSEWEPYAGLLLQHKPAEFFLLPDGTHLLVKPWGRLASSQGNADWFRFWLKGEDDPDPAKAEQYVRWYELRKLQAQQPTPSDTAATRRGAK